MENHALDPTIILGVNSSCCKSCTKNLKEALLKINVTVDPEKKKVYVRGKVNPMKLIKAIAKIGKRAELLSYEKELKEEDSRSESTETDQDKCTEENKNRKKKIGDYPKYSGRRKMEKDHKVEDYVPLKIDEEICRDPYCKIHKRRPIITNSVPSRDSGNHPNHTQGFFHGVNPLFHHRNPFHYYNPRMPMPGYGSYSGRPMPGFDEFRYYGDGGAWGYNMM